MTRARLLALLLLAGPVLFVPAGCGNKNVTPRDDIPPSRVKDLRVQAVTDSSVTLSWTAPGDDGTVGSASGYDFRRLDSPLSDQDWASGIPIAPVPAAAAGGTVQSFVFKGLPFLQRSYIALRAVDDAGNWSVMSNQVSATPGPPACLITPDSLAFGRLAVNRSFTLSFTVTNDGGGTLSEQAGDGCPPEFTVIAGSGPFALQAGETHVVSVRFTPAGPGEKGCAITLQGPCRSVPCTGSGAPEENPFVNVGAGTFIMGSPNDEPGRDPAPGEESVHQVTLTHSFLVCDHEVTQAEWTAVMGWNESAYPGADQPVDNVTWFDAIAYCNARSTAEGLNLVYDMGNDSIIGNHILKAGVVVHPDRNGYRLLSEAEWEYACRAGTQTAFFTGPLTRLVGCSPPDTNLARAGWYHCNAGQSSHPVRGLAANPWGIYDTHGNVYEWCWDYHAPYPGDTVDPLGPDFGDARIVRGGYFNSNAAECRSAYRLYHPPGDFLPEVGLRVARTAP